MEQTSVVINEVARLADAELIAGLQRWVRADRSVTARLLVHLGEVDARGLYRDRAWSSMFAYVVEELHMSEAEAYPRIAAARLSRRFPRIVELLAEGALHLTAIRLLGPHLTAENHVEVLERARGKATREIEQLVAELSPKPDVPSRMRKLPAPVAARAASSPADPEREVNAASTPLFAALARLEAGSSPAAIEPVPRDVSSITPLRPGRYKVEFTAGEAMHGKLEQLKALLRHQVPNGDLAIILECAADLLLEKTMKTRFAQTTRRRAENAAGAGDAGSNAAHHIEDAGSRAGTNDADGAQPDRAQSRYIPRSVVREVYARDGAQCTFVSTDGRRCRERGYLELHHDETPYALGGAATARNLRIVCRTHNALLAERDFGRAFMEAKLVDARSRARDGVTDSF